MKRFFLSAVLIFLFSSVFSQNIPVSITDLNKVYNTAKGTVLFNTNLFSTTDTVFNKSNSTVYVKLAKYQRALFMLTKVNGVYSGRFFKNNVIRYELTKTDSGYSFVPKEARDLLSNCIEQSQLEVQQSKNIYVAAGTQIDPIGTKTDLELVQMGWPCAFVDFDGYYNLSGAWTSPYTLLPVIYHNSTDSMNYVMNRVRETYSAFEVVITRDSTVYLAANQFKRARMVVTPSCGVYSCSFSGVTYLGSINWGDDTPGFAFYNPGVLAISFQYSIDVISHEIGHFFNLTHQASYTAGNCSTPSNQYNRGYGTGDTSFCPLMGANTASRNMAIWWNGTTPYGCTNFQDDMYNLTTGAGTGVPIPYRKQENGVAPEGARCLVKGDTLIQTLWPIANDTDYIKAVVTTNGTTTFTVYPWSSDAGGIHTMNRMKMRLYNSKGTLLASSVDNGLVSATISGTYVAGIYYLSISKQGTWYNPTAYGFLGHYKVIQQ